MANETKQSVDRIYLRDGRGAEQRVVETYENGGVVERVTEIHAEPVIPLALEQRIVEKVKPIVYEREIDTVRDGQIINKKVESLNPEVQMELRQHLGTVGDPNPTAVTREELRDLLSGLRQPCAATAVAPRRSLTAEQEIEARINQLGGDKVWVLGGLAVIACQVAALAYFLFVY